MPKPKQNNFFRTFSQTTSQLVGTPTAFFLAIAIVVIWAKTGPLFHFSDTWQLMINTSTSIITFLMVFLIQSTQGRDAKAMHLKLDELIHALNDARDKLVNVEDGSDEEIESLSQEFQQLHKHINEDKQADK